MKKYQLVFDHTGRLLPYQDGVRVYLPGTVSPPDYIEADDGTTASSRAVKSYKRRTGVEIHGNDL